MWMCPRWMQAEATDASEQLRAIARVLNVPTGAGQQHAAPLLAAGQREGQEHAGVAASTPSLRRCCRPAACPRSRCALLRCMHSCSLRVAQYWGPAAHVMKEVITSFCCVQMATLEQLAPELTQEYTVRRRMLIERAKVHNIVHLQLPERDLASQAVTV